jgi:hypothetical protein
MSTPHGLAQGPLPRDGELSPHPVLDLKIRDSLELADVVGDEDEIPSQGRARSRAPTRAASSSKDKTLIGARKRSRAA